MSKKEEKAKEYAAWLHKEIEEYYGQICDTKDMYYKNGDIRVAFEDGWDYALKNQWIRLEEKLPKDGEYIFILVEGEDGFIVPLLSLYNGGKFSILSKYFKVIAWMPIPSFDEILKENKDVLKRLKDKRYEQ